MSRELKERMCVAVGGYERTTTVNRVMNNDFGGGHIMQKSRARWCLQKSIIIIKLYIALSRDQKPRKLHPDHVGDMQYRLLIHQPAPNVVRVQIAIAERRRTIDHAEKKKPDACGMQKTAKCNNAGVSHGEENLEMQKQSKWVS